MRILYAIQGTGNGHVSRAREVVPHLKNHGEVDLLLSGTQSEVALNEPIKFKLHGLGFAFGINGGVDFRKSWRDFYIGQFLNDCRTLPVEDYDLIINDFEPVCAWACRYKGKQSTALSHQSAFLSDKTPQFPGFHYGKTILKNYAPTTNRIGFHFGRYDDFIRTPVIRSEIRSLKPKNAEHYTVYLPAYSDEFILQQISKFSNTRWEIFSKHSSTQYARENAIVIPINNQLFLKSLEMCRGLLTGGGFEGPAEALFLGKKLLAVPMKNQYEQQCNALALEKMGIPIVWHEREFAEKLQVFVHTDTVIQIEYPDETAEIIKTLIEGSKL